MSAYSWGACSLFTTSTRGMTWGGAYQWQMIIWGSSFSGTTSKMFMAEVLEAMITSEGTQAASCSYRATLASRFSTMVSWIMSAPATASSTVSLKLMRLKMVSTSSGLISPSSAKVCSWAFREAMALFRVFSERVHMVTS